MMANEYEDYMVETDKRKFIVEARDGVLAKRKAKRIARKNNEKVQEIYRLV